MKIRILLFSLLAFWAPISLFAEKTPIPLADPTIFYHQGTYYLYGTGSSNDQGFLVYSSTDLETWSGPVGAGNGFALVKGEAYGDKGFWAPQVFAWNNKFYMAYTANEQIAIAVSDDPKGPFRQPVISAISGEGKQIDPYVFFDDDGKIYLYHVRLTHGNRIFVAELQPDLSDILPATVTPVLHGELPWENTQNVSWPVTEGPTVLKHKKKYYLLYSANDYRNIDYAVGYAVSDSPLGPWTKSGDSPIISRKNTGINGIGHGDVLRMPDGSMKYVLHTHHDQAKVHPRLSGIVDLRFEPAAPHDHIAADGSGFRYLYTEGKTLINPLLPSGADPFCFYKEGYYYYTHTLGNRLALWKVKNLADLQYAKEKTIYVPPANTAYSKNLWAPEIHFIRGKWYVYFAADDGRNENHRMYVLENASEDPMEGTWELKGKVADPADKWAIDGNVFEHAGQLYMLWSGWEGDVNGQQNIYIAKMSDPWTLQGERVCISKPQYDWEKHGDLNDANNPPHVSVNEGPQALFKDNQLFVVFSASGCWTDFYTLGLLRFTGGDNLLDATKWVKDARPVFVQAPEKKVFAVGHNSFFKSPDGNEDWILYHANSEAGQGCGRFRSPRAQRFFWKEDGSPDFGEPVGPGIPIKAPR